MNRAGLARSIAPSLTLGAWSYDEVLRGLLRRLPGRLHRLAPQIADDLIKALPLRYAPSSNAVANVLKTTAAFEEIYVYCEKRAIWPVPDLTSPRFAPVAAFAQLDLPRLATTAALAEWLVLPVERMDYLADLTARYEEHGETSINHYHYMLRPKKSGGTRLIEAPKQGLKAVQSKLLHDIVAKIPNHGDSFGFVAGRNCLQAANRHTGEDVVLGFDLRDYFPSIGAGRVFGLFRCLGYPHNVARYLTGLCTTATPPRILARMAVNDRQTYRAGHLTQGSPVSPALANQITFNLDRRLSALARRLGANYSRYADDLSFSGDPSIVAGLAKLVPRIVVDEGFGINSAKTRVMAKTSRQVVTGVVVNRHLNVDRRYFDNLKAVIHACGKPGDKRLNDPQFRASLMGKIGWVEAVNPNRGHKLRDLLSVALENHQLR